MKKPAPFGLIILIFTCCVFVGCSPSYHTSLKRFGSLKLEENEVFQLKGNAVSFDSLVLKPGSVLTLDKTRKKAILRVNHFIFNNATIDGAGTNGDRGIGGTQGSGSSMNGFAGAPGVNLELYISSITATGGLTVDLRGGDGGTSAAETIPKAYMDQPKVRFGSETIPLAGSGGAGGSILLFYPETSRELVESRLVVLTDGGFATGATAHEKNPNSLVRGTRAADGTVQRVMLKN